MLWVLLLVLLIVLLVALVGGIAYRGRAGASASPQTTIIESGRGSDTTAGTRRTTVGRTTEIVDDR